MLTRPNDENGFLNSPSGTVSDESVPLIRKGTVGKRSLTPFLAPLAATAA